MVVCCYMNFYAKLLININTARKVVTLSIYYLIMYVFPPSNFS